jgi:hypothetical protein
MWNIRNHKPTELLALRRPYMVYIQTHCFFKPGFASLSISSPDILSYQIMRASVIRRFLAELCKEIDIRNTSVFQFDQAIKNLLL